MVWINGKQVAGDSVCEAIICEKATHLHSGITRDTSWFLSKEKLSCGNINEPQLSTNKFHIKEG
jgi:hypothetical protein